MIETLLISTALYLIPVRNNGQYAQNNEWWNKQLVPSGPNAGSSCCSLSDGTFAEEYIECDKYFVDFVATDYNGVQFPQKHMEVPDVAVIKEPNPYGRAIVWYSWQTDNRNTPVHVYIRCFIAGGGV